MSERSHDLNDDARRALELLRSTPTVSVSSARAAGISMPAQAFYALQLAGWPVKRKGDQWRLVGPDEVAPPKAPPRPRVVRVSRDPDA